MSEDRKNDALKFARSVPYTYLATEMDGQPFIRLMLWCRIEDDFTVWLSTRASSIKVQHIERNPRVCTMFADEIGYVRVFGKAEIINDPKLKEEFWDDSWDIYWPEGKDDPDYRLLKIVPDNVDFLNQADGDIVAKPL